MPAAEIAAIKVAEAFIEAFNAQDSAGVAATLNYPHIRLANGRYMRVDSAEDFIAISEKTNARLADEGWHHTVMVSIEAVHSGADKVHLVITNDRCHEDGTVYNKFDTFWIATLQDDHWGIQFRSSFLR